MHSASWSEHEEQEEGSDGVWASRLLDAMEQSDSERDLIARLEECCQSGWDCSEPFGDRAETMLMLSVETQMLGLAEWLLERGADACRKNSSGKSALWYASLTGSDAAVRILVQACACEQEPADLAFGLAIDNRLMGEHGLSILAGIASKEALEKAACSVDGSSVWGAMAWRVATSKLALKEARELSQEVGCQGLCSTAMRI